MHVHRRHVQSFGACLQVLSTRKKQQKGSQPQALCLDRHCWYHCRARTMNETDRMLKHIHIYIFFLIHIFAWHIGSEQKSVTTVQWSYITECNKDNLALHRNISVLWIQQRIKRLLTSLSVPTTSIDFEDSKENQNANCNCYGNNDHHYDDHHRQLPVTFLHKLKKTSFADYYHDRNMIFPQTPWCLFLICSPPMVYIKFQIPFSSSKLVKFLKISSHKKFLWYSTSDLLQQQPMR